MWANTSNFSHSNKTLLAKRLLMRHRKGNFETSCRGHVTVVGRIRKPLYPDFLSLSLGGCAVDTVSSLLKSGRAVLLKEFMRCVGAAQGRSEDYYLLWTECPSFRAGTRNLHFVS